MATYLEDTIKSAIANLQPGDEYFVIDGGSTDGSVDIIRRYEDRITGWVSEADAGYADALRKGFERSTGDILCWINAGDLYLSGAFDAARKLLTDDVDLIFGDDFYVDDENKVISFSRGWVPDLRMAMLYGGWSPLQDACFWRRSFYEDIGGIDASLRFAADYGLFLHMAVSGRTRYAPTTFSAFRRHSGQISVSGAVGYKQERMRLKESMIQSDKISMIRKIFCRCFFRFAFSARARLAPLMWRRSDLAKSVVQDLPCGGYWPATSTK